MKRSITALLGCALFSSLMLTAHPKIAHDLDGADPQSTSDVIVQFKSAPTEAHHEKVRSRGGSLRSELLLVKAGSYSIPASALQDLANDPEVAYISPNRKIHRTLDNTTAAVNASAAWKLNLTGAGIGVAVIDSGITTDQDLGSGSVVYNESWVNNDFHDYYGHGTHVAGILAGSGSRSVCSNCFRDLQGLAPGAKIINLRVLDQNGEGTDSGVIAAINRAISLKSKYNIRVINLSLGRPVFESYTKDPLCQAVEAAWKAGIAVVVAAGNDGRDNSQGTNGYGTITAPGNDPYVITVGAMRSMGTPSRSDDLVASYSSKGPTVIDHIVKPDLVAPGNQVTSLYSSTGSLYSSYPGNMVPMSYFMNNAGSGSSNLYFTLSGTSMATPVVSGAVALLLQSNPALTPDQVKAKLMLTSYKTFPASSVATDAITGLTYVSNYDVFTVGSGYLDIKAALADKTKFSGTSLSPVATYNSIAKTSTVVCAASTVCAARATNTMWGANTMWGGQYHVGSQHGRCRRGD